MTAESLEDHDVSSDFVWDAKYSDQLQLLADTDEMTDDIVWPPLKDGIKHLLKQTFHQWPSSSAPILHPATALLPLHSQSADHSSNSSTNVSAQVAAAANGHATASDTSNGEHHDQNDDVDEDDDIQTSHVAAQALADRFRTIEEAEDTSLERGIASVKEADMHAFFPSKKQAPAEWKGSWGKRIDSESELKAERRTIFAMLDDFENQPPFTIQRLSELVLRPTEHHHTLPKYISALKRLLSVTATRDAFPSNPGEGEEEEDAEEEDEMAVEGVEVNGAGRLASRSPSVHSRSSSVPGSPRTAPLFSPIPFLMRSGDEGMPGAGPSVGNGQARPTQDLANEGEQGSVPLSSDDFPMSDRDVPVMELGGADRTTEQAAEQARRKGKGAGSSQSIADAATQNVQANDSAAGEASTEASTSSSSSGLSSSSHQPVASSNVGKPEDLPMHEARAATIVSGDVGARTSNEEIAAKMSAKSTSSASGASEPLGVPAGPVDEVDQVGEKHGQLPPLDPDAVAGGARALTSTTSGAQPSSGSLLEQPKTEGGRKQEADVAPTESGERALKRIRSERNLGKLASESEEKGTK